MSDIKAELEGNLRIEKYIDAESLAFYRTKLPKPLVHEFQLWELLPDELRQYLIACATVRMIEMMTKEICGIVKEELGKSGTITIGTIADISSPVNEL